MRGAGGVVHAAHRHPAEAMTPEEEAFYAACRERATPAAFLTQVIGLPGKTLLDMAKALYHQSDALLLCARRLSQMCPVPDESDDGDRIIRSLANALTTAFEWNAYLERVLTAIADEYPKAPYPEQA